MGELREIRESAEAAAESASKAKKEIEMMLSSARDGLWTEVNQAEVGSTTLKEAMDALTDSDRDTMREQITETKELLAKAKEELGDGEGPLEDIEDGLKKGLEQDMVGVIEKKLEDLEAAL